MSRAVFDTHLGPLSSPGATNKCVVRLQPNAVNGCSSVGVSAEKASEYLLIADEWLTAAVSEVSSHMNPLSEALVSGLTGK